MRFFRFKNFMSMDTIKYLRYAIGEIILVVGGILIALQVNNYNEELNNKKLEKKILLSLHNEISSSLLNCNLVISKKREIVSSSNKIISEMSPDGNWDSKFKLDSLIFHVTNSGWRHVPQEGVLNEIINSGKLTLISDNKLKTLISSLPRAYSQMIENDRINRLNITTNVVPFFFGKSYLRNSTNYIDPFEFSDASQGLTKFKINNSRLLRDPELEDILSYLSNYNKYGIEFLEKAKLKYHQIQQLIESKYPDVDYDKLEKDLDRGVWN